MATGKRLENWLTLLRAWDKPGWMRAALAAAAFFGVAAFILGAGNRFTSGPWFLYIPEVTLIPPIGRAAWEQAFVIHQQSPLYALCGGYEVGGMESITVYQFLYGWEWVRIASVALFVAVLFLALIFFLCHAAKSARRPDLLPWIGLVAAGVSYLVLRYFADHAGLFATINLGQHRHALDVTFASVGLAMLIVGAVAPGRSQAGSAIPRLAWGSAIALNIAFGALFEALDAGPLWTTFPGYTDSLLPSSDRLFAFNPIWRNLTENGYLIQTCHRVLSIGLWAAASLAVVTAVLRGLPWTRAAVLFGLLTLEGALGVATLRAGEPLVLSIVHQACAIAVLAAALAPRDLWARPLAQTRAAPPSSLIRAARFRRDRGITQHRFQLVAKLSQYPRDDRINATQEMPHRNAPFEVEEVE
jgi:cytochrome c oxidase assembly protein subunit 15